MVRSTESGCVVRGAVEGIEAKGQAAVCRLDATSCAGVGKMRPRSFPVAGFLGARGIQESSSTPDPHRLDRRNGPKSEYLDYEHSNSLNTLGSAQL